MARRLPYIYAAVIVLGTLLLAWRYAADPPAPSDPLGLALGWGGIGAMVVMLVYSIARRSRPLRQIARLSYWLHFHIFLGVAGPIMVTFHSLHVFTREAPLRWLNPGLLNFVAVLIVFCSGLFGRYMYSMLPRALSGERLDAKEVEREISAAGELPAEVRALIGAPNQKAGFLALVAADFETRRALRRLEAMDLPAATRELARRRLRLERRMAVLAGADRIFRRWIVLHRPIASIMYVLTAVHVVLAYMFSPSLGR